MRQRISRQKAFLFFALLIVMLNACGGSGSNPPLQAPENLTLTSTGPHHVKLSWTASPTLSAHFVIKRSDDSGEYTEIGEVSSSVNEYVDDGVSPDITYVYQVYAEDDTRQSDAVYSEPYHHPYFDACATPVTTSTAPSVSFYDMPVSGLHYITSTTESVSDPEGTFTWDQASDVQFSIGYVNIGPLHAGDKPGILTIAKNLDGRTETTLYNLLRLFIALDEDHDTTNGIQLPCELSLAYGDIDPTVDKDSFAQQETVQRLTADSPLPLAKDAETLYEQYLFHDYIGHYQVQWSAKIGGLIDVGAKFSFDLDKNGTISNEPESVVSIHIDPHDDYHLEIVDLSALILGGIGFYELEFDAHILQDKTIQGEVVLKSVTIGDTTGDVWGGRI